MAKHNAFNERIKREYFHYLKEARRRGEASIDAAAKALGVDPIDAALGIRLKRNVRLDTCLGTDDERQAALTQIRDVKSEEEIRESWEPELI